MLFRSVAKDQIDMNLALMSHTHQVPIGAGFLIATPSIPLSSAVSKHQGKLFGTIEKVSKWKMNINKWLKDYTSRDEAGYINSKFNNVN